MDLFKPGQVWTCHTNRHNGYRCRILKVMPTKLYIEITNGSRKRRQTTLGQNLFLAQWSLG